MDEICAFARIGLAKISIMNHIDIIKLSRKEQAKQNARLNDLFQGSVRLIVLCLNRSFASRAAAKVSAGNGDCIAEARFHVPTCESI